jgi:hypothetical protein
VFCVESLDDTSFQLTTIARGDRTACTDIPWHELAKEQDSSDPGPSVGL